MPKRQKCHNDENDNDTDKIEKLKNNKINNKIISENQIVKV